MGAPGGRTAEARPHVERTMTRNTPGPGASVRPGPEAGLSPLQGGRKPARSVGRGDSRAAAGGLRGRRVGVTRRPASRHPVFPGITDREAAAAAAGGGGSERGRLLRGGEAAALHRPCGPAEAQGETPPGPAGSPRAPRVGAWRPPPPPAPQDNRTVGAVHGAQGCREPPFHACPWGGAVSRGSLRP